MASIIRRTYTRVVDGVKVTKKYKHWTIQYRDAAGRLKRIKGYVDKGATKQLAARLEAQTARGEQGLLDPFRAHRRRPIGEHITEYVADLEGSGSDDKYVENARNRLNRLAKECRWTCLDDVEHNGANTFAAWRERERKDEGGRKGRLGKGTAARTLNHYLDIARAFTNWCATQGRMPGVPIGGGRKMATALAGVAKVDGEAVRKRRALTDEQVVKLIAVAAERALCYRFGIATGLRRQELQDLVWGDVRLIAIKPYVQLRAWATKARRGDRVDLTASLADDLRAARTDDAKDSDPVFPDVPPIAQWKLDLAAAGIPYKDEMGRRLDFHGGCRQTLCTRLHAAGVPQREAMRRMRVTDPKLLNDVYADDEQLAAGAVPLPEPAAAAKKTATGAG